LVINKVDLAPHVGASLEVMARDSQKMRGAKPYLFTNCMTNAGIDAVVALIKREVLFEGVAPAGRE
jgi:urease accessory protein